MQGTVQIRRRKPRALRSRQLGSWGSWTPRAGCARAGLSPSVWLPLVPPLPVRRKDAFPQPRSVPWAQQLVRGAARGCAVQARQPHRRHCSRMPEMAQTWPSPIPHRARCARCARFGPHPGVPSARVHGVSVALRIQNLWVACLLRRSCSQHPRRRWRVSCLSRSKHRLESRAWIAGGCAWGPPSHHPWRVWLEECLCGALKIPRARPMPQCGAYGGGLRCSPGLVARRPPN
jgi:hypothetical protein